MAWQTPKVPVPVPVSEPQPANGDVPSTSSIFRNPAAKDAFPELPTGEKTLYELFANAAKKHGDKACLGKRNGDGPYQWLTYKQV
jgi:hypothetical protein